MLEALLVSDPRRSRIFKLFKLGDGIRDVTDEHVCHISRHSLTDYDTHHRHVVDVPGLLGISHLK